MFDHKLFLHAWIITSQTWLFIKSAQWFLMNLNAKCNQFFYQRSHFDIFSSCSQSFFSRFIIKATVFAWGVNLCESVIWNQSVFFREYIVNVQVFHWGEMPKFVILTPNHMRGKYISSDFNVSAVGASCVLVLSGDRSESMSCSHPWEDTSGFWLQLN